MAEQSYWDRRAVLLNESLLERGEAFYKNLAAAYELAGNRIGKEIDAFYNRFAKDNKISFAEAKKLLTSDERKSFMMDVKDYISRAKELPYSPEWALRLENTSNVHRVTRLEYLSLQMRQQVEEAYSKYDSGMKRVATETYENGYYRSLYEAELAEGESLPFAMLDTGAVRQTVNKPWAPDGTNFSDKIWKDRTRLVDYLNTEVSQAFIRGESADRLIREIKKQFGAPKLKAGQIASNAARLIQTEMAYFSAMAKKESYKTLGFKKYIVVAAMDYKTSAICREMNDEVFDVEDFQPGVTANPFHPNCRTTTAPFVEKDDGAVGPGKVKDPKTGKLTEIPRDMSYKEWLGKRLAEAETADGTKESPEKDVKLLEGTPDDIIGLTLGDTDVDARYANGLRRSALTDLSDDDIVSLKDDIRAIEADESVFLFNEGQQTGYADNADVIFVRGDVFPDDVNSTHPRDLLSPRAVLAHEYYGHRANRGTTLEKGSWNDEFRASYMAAKNAPELSHEEKANLLRDAMERAKEAGVTVRLNAFMRRTLYGDDYV